MKYTAYTLFLCSFFALSMVILLESTYTSKEETPFSAAASEQFSQQANMQGYAQ